MGKPDRARPATSTGTSQRAFLNALFLLLISCATVYAGVALGARFVPPNAGYPQVGDVHEDLFRFDSIYYYTIARDGYSYSGDPNSSPNIVFAPLFPLLVSALSALGMDTVVAGFGLSHVLLYFAFYFLFLFLQP